MAELEPEGQGSVSPTADPEGFMAQMREKLSKAEPEEQPGEGEAPPAPTAEAATPATPAEGAEEPASASPQPAATGWRDIPIPEDVASQYRFFQGKKTGDFFDSYRALEHEFQERGKKQRELETKLIALETWKEMAAPAAPAPKPRDPFEGLDPQVDPIANPEKWEAARQEHLKQQLESVAVRAKEETLAEVRKEREAEQFKAHAAAVTNTIKTVIESLGVDPSSEIAADLAPALLNGNTRRYGFQRQTDPEAYLEVARSLGIGPKPSATAANLPPPTPPPAANPPGSKRSGAAGSEPTRAVPTLRAEQRQLLNKLAKDYEATFGPEKATLFKERLTAKLAGGN